MAQLIILSPGLISSISVGETSEQLANQTMGQKGGIIFNPLLAQDQGIAVAESLYVSLLGPAGVAEELPTGTTRLLPGQKFLVPPKVNVWVNAKTSGHSFTAYFTSTYTPQYPPGPVPGAPGFDFLGVTPFPPGSVTGLTKEIPSYLYQEYSDDMDLQGFVDAQNNLQQNYVDTFNALNLPIYPGPIVSDKLLDWVGQGLYGFPRPALSSGIVIREGPLNTWGPNFLIPTENANINGLGQAVNETVVITDDDTYRRCITWHFYKGDGKYFNTRWLKRRIWRFLYGTNGWSPDYASDPTTGATPISGQADSDDAFIADTEQISITFGTNREVTIRFVLGKRTVTGGAMLNAFGCNGFGPPSFPTVNKNFAPIPLNDIESTYVKYLPLPYMSIFQEALQSGVLEMPYQFQFNVVIG
jgi:hypothetical protein